MHFIDIFPLSVFVMKAEFDQTYRNEMATVIKQQKEKKPKASKSTSTWTGDIHGDVFLHNDPVFDKLMVRAGEVIDAYLDGLMVEKELISRHITRCWGTYATERQAISNHSHISSHLSLVYYVKVPPKSPGLTILNDAKVNEFVPGTLSTYSFKSGLLDPQNTTSRFATSGLIGVQEDYFVVFPSKIEHLVNASPTTEPRVSIAFDTLFTQKKHDGHEQWLPPIETWRSI